MRTFAVDNTSDIFIDGTGELAIARNQNAVMYVCEQYARAVRGEMIHKMNRGMPYLETGFRSDANLAQFEAAFKRRMSEIPQVIAVRSFNAEIIDNVLKYTAEIETVFGTGQLQNA